jgi:NAD(P)-dependent dehydrogenase (short-subunit alcohol dehydrogenase family)
MRTALIIGASRGIGREFVRQLLADSYKVFATARDDATVEALKQEGAHAMKIDVTVAESLAGLPWQLDGERLDLVVYVAGVFGSYAGATEAPAVTEFDRVMHANVLGAMQAIPLLAPMVEAANGSFVFLTSVMGSIGATTASMGWVYRASKAALNMVVKAAAIDYPKAKLMVIHPGWVQTEMGGPSAPTSVQDSVTGMRKVIHGLKQSESGSFHSFDGQVMVW